MSKIFFGVGHRYRAKWNFRGDLCEFHAGEILVLRKEGFNRYDEAYVYEFENEEGVMKAWMVYNARPIDWTDYFEPI